MKKEGKITVYTGPMRSGKSEALIGKVVKYKIANKKIVVIKPEMDTRDKDGIVSRNGFSFKENLIICKNLDDVCEKINSLNFNPELIAIDEFHFFDSENNSDWIQKMFDWSILWKSDIIVSGLDLSYSGKPFDIMGKIMCLANEVVKFTAICSHEEEDDATMTVLNKNYIVSGQEKIVGGDDIYSPVSRKIWYFKNLVDKGTKEKEGI
jgi:thymidine kinase